MIPIELDRPRNLRYTRKSMVAAEDHFRIGFARMAMNPGVKSTWMMLYAGLIHEDPTLTPDKVGDLMDLYVESGKSLVDLDQKIMDGLIEGGWLHRAGSGDSDPEAERGGT